MNGMVGGSKPSGTGRQRPNPTGKGKGKATSPIFIDESEDSQSSYKASDVAQAEGGGSGEHSSDEEVWCLDDVVDVLTIV